MSAFADAAAALFEEAARAAQVPLACRICSTVVAHVNPPAPTVPVTCSRCREVLT